jgi:DDE_Tnp_1-associated
MQYTLSSALTARTATPDAALAALVAPAHDLRTPASPVRVPWHHLPTLFATIPDPRARQGTRHPLPAILAAMLAGFLTNHRSQLATAEWLADQPPACQAALGFPPGRTPHQSTFNRVLAAVDPTYLAVPLRQLFALTPPDPRGSQAVALDGKAQRGRLPAPRSLPAPRPSMRSPPTPSAPAPYWRPPRWAAPSIKPLPS